MTRTEQQCEKSLRLQSIWKTRQRTPNADLNAARHVVSKYTESEIPIVFEIAVHVLEIISNGSTKKRLESVLSRLQDLIVSPVPRLQPKIKQVNLSLGEAKNDVMRGAHDLTIELLKFAAPESIDEFDELWTKF